MIISGIGYDSHRFEKGLPLILGGIKIPHEYGLKAHSDGDVLCHAIIDAIFGACGKKDIGSHFPDTDPKYKNADSIKLLQEAVSIIKKDNSKLEYIDCIIILEKPKFAPYRDSIIANISKASGISQNRINIKAKTNEGMGFIGQGEGIAVFANVTVERSF